MNSERIQRTDTGQVVEVRLDEEPYCVSIDGALGDRIVIFDPATVEDGRSIGWAVDSAEEISEIADDTVDGAPIGGEYINRLARHDSGFLVWIEPRLLDGTLDSTDPSTTEVATRR
ncbi:MAG: hypothetical protein ACQET5_12735 [Halobacteriota archaeon]|uniref:hypothetical protein n=1 Tax=Natronomonas sp. TaxID=2184060 RepID=UPI00397599B4